MNDSGGKFVILGPVESDDAQTMRGLPHMGSKKAVSEHVLWERSPLFGFPTRVIHATSTAFGLRITYVYSYPSYSVKVQISPYGTRASSIALITGRVRTLASL